MKRIALAAIRFYQSHVAPGLSPACRFQPTCSHYAYDAVETYGAARGVVMAGWRILRCNPLNKGGYDPVPERRHHPKGSPQA